MFSEMTDEGDKEEKSGSESESGDVEVIIESIRDVGLEKKTVGLFSTTEGGFAFLIIVVLSS